MTDHDDRDDLAIEALRRFDQPHDPDPGSMQRMEARVLDRFDEVMAAGDAASDGTEADLIELRSDDAPVPTRRGGLWLGLAAAAAVVALVAAVLLIRTNAADVEVPATQPPSAEDDALVAEEQLRAYCAEFVEPLNRTSSLWRRDGFDSEERADVLVAVEQAAQGLVDLANPASVEFDGRDMELLQLATDARRASTLGIGADDAVTAARDAIYAELEASTIAAELPECRSS